VTRSSSRCSAVPHPGVSLFKRYCDTKKHGWQNSVFWTQNKQRTHHKVGIARPPKAIHTVIYATGACPYTHRATDNRHTKCAGLPWWSFGSRRARIVCGGSFSHFSPNMPWRTLGVGIRPGSSGIDRIAARRRGVVNRFFPPILLIFFIIIFWSGLCQNGLAKVAQVAPMGAHAAVQMPGGLTDPRHGAGVPKCRKSWGVHTARKTLYFGGNPGKRPKSRNFAPLDSRALKAP
jgi:hypothetical protein